MMYSSIVCVTVLLFGSSVAIPDEPEHTAQNESSGFVHEPVPIPEGELAPFQIEWIPVNLADESDPDPLVTLDANQTAALSQLRRQRVFDLGRINFVGIIKGAVSGFQGLAALLKAGKDLLKFFGLDEKETAILVDNRCPRCFLYLKCSSGIHTTSEFQVSAEDGYILKFNTWHGGIFGNFGVVNYACSYRDGNRNRKAKMDAFGIGAPREKSNLYEVRDNPIVRIAKGGNVDGRQSPTRW